MLKLIPPVFGVREILAAAGSGPRIDRVTVLSAPLEVSETDYAARMDAPSIHTMPRSQSGIAGEFEADISWAYESQMQSRRGGAREHYSVLRATSRKCPLCLQRDSTELDHYLPRDTHPTFAVQPTNLVPICSVCNKKKLNQVAVTPEDQFLHPYFDDLGGAAWLRATLIEVQGAPVIFSVARQPDWDDVTMKRVEWHFIRFGLSTLYSDQVGTTLGGYRELLDSTHRESQAAGVKKLMLMTGESFRSYGAEPWLSAAMQAWGESPWFCDMKWNVRVPEGPV